MAWLKWCAVLLLAMSSLSGCAAAGRAPRAGGDGGVADSGADAGDAGGPDFTACETSTQFAEPEPATLMFQVDSSGSMNCDATDVACQVGDPTPAPDDSRWDALRAAMGQALMALPDTTVGGLMHFPLTFSCAGAESTVDLGAMSSNRGTIVTALDGITPEGITPTHDAVLYAFSNLRMANAAHPFLVLATDGEATVCEGCDPACSEAAQGMDNQQMVEDIRAAASEGIRTFVIGVPGSQNFRGILSAMAEAGGTGVSAGCSENGPNYCHYDLTDSAVDLSGQLVSVLGEISDALLSCEYAIPANPDGAFDAERVNVVITDENGEETVIPRDAAKTNGWDYDADQSHIILHGTACETAQMSSTGSRIDIAFGCPTVLI